MARRGVNLAADDGIEHQPAGQFSRRSPVRRAWHGLVLAVHFPAVHAGGIDPTWGICIQNFVPRGTKFCRVGFAPSRLWCSSVVKLSALLRIISSQKNNSSPLAVTLILSPGLNGLA